MTPFWIGQKVISIFIENLGQEGVIIELPKEEHDSYVIRFQEKGAGTPYREGWKGHDFLYSPGYFKATDETVGFADPKCPKLHKNPRNLSQIAE